MFPIRNFGPRAKTVRGKQTHHTKVVESSGFYALKRCRVRRPAALHLAMWLAARAAAWHDKRTADVAFEQAGDDASEDASLVAAHQSVGRDPPRLPLPWPPPPPIPLHRQEGFCFCPVERSVEGSGLPRPFPPSRWTTWGWFNTLKRRWSLVENTQTLVPIETKCGWKKICSALLSLPCCAVFG